MSRRYVTLKSCLARLPNALQVITRAKKVWQEDASRVALAGRISFVAGDFFEPGVVQGRSFCSPQLLIWQAILRNCCFCAGKPWPSLDLSYLD